MRRQYFLFVCIFYCLGTYSQDTTQQIVPGRRNSVDQQQKPYLILISVDGLRNDLAKHYNASNILRLAEQGVSAKYMQPSFPSLTFPNHYTIVTGLYPAHHGLVNNSFYDEERKRFYTMSDRKAVADSSWYGGVPIWALAEQQQLLTASYFWVASESNIKGYRPTYSYIYNDKTRIESRIEAVKNWLQLAPEVRPHLITFYFPQVDHAEHISSVHSPETEEAIRFVDDAIGKLVSTVDSLGLPVNYLIVSDHGMTDVDLERGIPTPKSIDSTQFIISTASALIQLYAKDKQFVMATYDALRKEASGYKVYLTTHMPARWHFGKTDDYFNRIGDIILTPNPPRFFQPGRKTTKGTGRHGYDPAMSDMRASFYAWGPSIRKSKRKLRPFENVHVYPLMAELLGLKYQFSIDGDMNVLKGILR